MTHKLMNHKTSRVGFSGCNILRTFVSFSLFMKQKKTFFFLLFFIYIYIVLVKKSVSVTYRAIFPSSVT